MCPYSTGRLQVTRGFVEGGRLLLFLKSLSSATRTGGREGWEPSLAVPSNLLEREGSGLGYWVGRGSVPLLGGGSGWGESVCAPNEETPAGALGEKRGLQLMKGS